MNNIDEQRQLVDKIYWLVRDSLGDEYDTATCRIDYPRFDDGSSSIGTRLSYERKGDTKYGQLRYPDDLILYDVVPQLHAAMKAHTGGDWQAFTLTINKDGSVTTKFEYQDET